MAEELAVEEMIKWLKEDIPFWDTTSNLIPEGIDCRAIILAKERGIAACIEEVSLFLEKLGLRVKMLKRSRQSFEPGEALIEVTGYLRKILQVERLVLNILAHACGVATITKRAVEVAQKVNPRVRIAATRKTLPGLRYIEKRAIEAGGGDTHRLSLSDMVLIKDNHLAYFGSIERAIEVAKARTSFAHKIEVEVESPQQAVRAAEVGADIVMLDNFAPSQVKKAIYLLEEKGLRDKVIIEVSGGVNLKNLRDYAVAGPDIISMGLLTHTAPAIDLSLEVVERCGE